MPRDASTPDEATSTDPPVVRTLRDRRWGGFLVLVGVLLLTALGFTLAHFWSPHADLRVTTGPQGGAAQRLMSAFVSVSEIQHPRIRLELVQVNDLLASAKALEDGRTDLAIVRTDAALPVNGQTIVILRRDVVAFVVPPHTHVTSIAGLTGKTVGIPAGPLQADNARVLDTILSFFDIPAQRVERVFLPVAELGKAVQDRTVAAVLAVGPVAPGEVVDAVAAIAKATKGTPTLLSLDEADTIGKRFPGFESIDVPAGAFRAHPDTPADTVTTVAVTYRFVASELMSNVVAAAIARSILTAKAKLLAVTPLASQIEAPDPSDTSPILPVHPGVAEYLSGGDQSFLDQFQKYFYVIGIGISLAGSLFAAGTSYWTRRRSAESWRPIRRLVEIADEASHAGRDELDVLLWEFRGLASDMLGKQAGLVDADHLSAFSTALAHARHALDARASVLGPETIPNVEARSAPSIVASR
jgi:TRAP-type uncharacterized transport system substrate-binding protein